MAKRSKSDRAGTVAPSRPARQAPSPVAARSSRPGPLARLLAWLSTPSGYVVGAAVLFGFAAWARLAQWSWIFGSGRVELLPSDSHYYVRLALLHLHARAPVPFDPFVGFPNGSENYWPHLHTLLVTLAVALGPDPETGAAFVGPIASLLWFVVIAWAAYGALGGRGALFALFLLALTPMSIEAGKLGNADHNVHEGMLAALVVLLGMRAVRGSTLATVGAGALAGAARLFTTTGFVFPGILALSFAIAAMAAMPAERPGITRRAGLAGIASVVVLVVAVFALGYPARLDYEQLTLFHPLLAAGLFAVAVAGCAWLEGRSRAAALIALPAVALVPLIPQLLVAAAHLARRDPLLAVVLESRPLITDPLLAILLFGPALIALPFALFGAVRALRSHEAAAAVPLVSVVLFLIGAAAQERLALFLIGGTAALLPLGLARLIAPLDRITTWVVCSVAVLAFALLFPWDLWPTPPPGPGAAPLVRPTLEWMRDNLPPAAPDPLDWRAQPTYGVLAPFDYGHYITLYAQRPVLASPFSQTDAHVAANRVASEILSDTDEERAYQRIIELKLRYILAAPSDLFSAGPLPKEALLQRLLRREPFGRFEPLYVSTEKRRDGGRYATVFEVVQGAVLTGLAPAGSLVRADFGDGYVRTAPADAAGLFRVRLARPGVYGVSAIGPREGAVVGPVPVTITDEQIHAGAEVRVGAAR